MASSFRRPARDRFIGRRILIFCEGKTEAEYFHDIRKSLRLEPNRIVIQDADGTDPLSIVQEACAEREAHRRERRWVEENSYGRGDIAWAVFDGDEHIERDPDTWNQSIDLARRKKIRLAISNPCFELWYLLHYQDQTASLHRDEAHRLLKKHLPRYNKSQALYQKELKEATDRAIQRASQVCANASRNKVGIYENPCTHVWELVELILSLQREAR